MSKKHTIMLVSLGAIWGASFMFMRILSPVFGPVLTASFRLLIGAVILISFSKGFKLSRVFTHWKMFLMLGAVSLGIPYFLFSLAALYIPSGLSAVLNSTSPMFSFLFSIFLFSERICIRKIIGLVLGTSGVFIISMDAVSVSQEGAIIGILACVVAAFLYAVTGVIIKTTAKDIDSRTLAVGNQLFGGLLLLPFVFIYPITGEVTLNIILLLIIFGALGSGLASMMYYKLMVEVGPLKTLTVTYLLPIFGVFWGYVILGELLSTEFLIGGVLIILGTILITRKKVTT